MKSLKRIDWTLYIALAVGLVVFGGTAYWLFRVMAASRLMWNACGVIGLGVISGVAGLVVGGCLALGLLQLLDLVADRIPRTWRN